MAVKFTKTDLSKGSKQLADHLCGELQTAIDARHALKQRWEQNERVYRDEPGIAAVRLYDNFEPRIVPVLSPRVNRIVNVTMNALSAPSVTSGNVKFGAARAGRILRNGNGHMHQWCL